MKLIPQEEKSILQRVEEEFGQKIIIIDDQNFKPEGNKYEVGVYAKSDSSNQIIAILANFDTNSFLIDLKRKVIGKKI